MTRLSHPRAELELLERLNALQGAVSAGDEAAKRKLDLTISNAISYVMGQYNALAEIAPSKIASSTEVAGKQRSPREISFLRRAFLLYNPRTTSGWVLHTLFYMIAVIFVFVTLGDVLNVIFTGSVFFSGSSQIGANLLTLAIDAAGWGIPLLILQRLARRNARRNAA